MKRTSPLPPVVTRDRGEHDRVRLPSVQAVFTTGEAAFLSQTSHQHVIRAMEAGKLAGWKVGSHRRCSRRQLILWMLDVGIPLDITTHGKAKRGGRFGKPPEDWPTYGKEFDA